MTDTIKIIKPHPGTEPKGAPVKAPAWKNIDFEKNGRAHVQSNTFPTEAAAKEKADSENNAISELIAVGRGRKHRLLFADGGQSYLDEFSHTIQIPARAP